MSDKIDLNDRSGDSKGGNTADKPLVSLDDHESFINQMSQVINDLKDGKAPSYVNEIFGKPLIIDSDESVALQRVPRKKAEAVDTDPRIGNAKLTPDADAKPADAKPEPAADAKPADAKTADAKPAEKGAAKQINPDEDELLKSKVQKDGTWVNEYKSGVIEQYDPKTGEVIRVIPNGDKPPIVETSKDNEWTRNEDGKITKTVRRDDGILETTGPNGDKRFDDKDSSLVFHKDKSWEYSNKDGTRSYSKDGELLQVTKTDADGNVVTTFSDGSTSTIKKDRTIINEDKDMKMTRYSNETIVVEDKNTGTKTTTTRDGVTLTERKDGVRVLQDENGRRVLEDNEQVLFKNQRAA